jgi:hypothetical protein
LLEREHPGAVGLFLQGAQGDVNSCVVHKPEQDALLALDVVAARYANAVRAGLEQTTPVDVDAIHAARIDKTFPREPVTLAELRGLLAGHEATIHAPGACDDDKKVRMATVYVRALRRLVARMEAGEDLAPATEVQGFRVGPIAFLGAPFEIFQAVKNAVRDKAKAPVPLVMGITNDGLGYAPDREHADTGYAARQVPMILGELAYADIAGELEQALLELDGRLMGT